ncbi:MAG: M64 family metallopeptidase, partial [Alistipes sp.]
MKNLLLLCTLCVLFVGCGGDDPIPTPTSGLSINDASLNITLAETETSARVHFTAYENWTATIEAADNWCSISPSKGTAGDVTMNLQAQGNTTSDTQTAKITLTAGAMTKVINVIRGAGDVLTIKQDNYAVALAGGEIEVVVESNIAYDYMIGKEDKKWITPIESAATSRSLTTKTFRFRIAPFEEQGRRQGKIVFTDNKIRREVAVVQGTNYESTDFDADGKVVELQKATKGNGIDIIIMGDAFSDRQVTDGTYEKTMRKAMEAFFSEEPYTTFRELFNVSYVTVVSRNEGYIEGGSTALQGSFGEGTEVRGNDRKCDQYALKVPGMDANKYEDALVIVMMNRAHYAGTCYMFYPGHTGDDWGRGKSIAYFPLGTDEAMFTQLLIHEAGGHGFSKLADEYWYKENGRIPATELTDYKENVANFGWFKNIDITNEPAEI